MTTRSLATALCCLLIPLSLFAVEAVQIDVRPILTGRAVTTLSKGKLVPWTKGIDGGGLSDGYMTLSASVANGDKDAKALPNDGRFKATKELPTIQLNFSNADATGPQIRSVEGTGELTFSVPAKRYARLMIFLTSAEGPSELQLKLTYAGGTTDLHQQHLPDYFDDVPAGDPNLFSLTADLAKWGASGRMTEADHHHIHGVELHPNPQKELISVTVGKTAPGYLVFWGATGVTAK